MAYFLQGRLVEWLTAFGTIAAAASAVWLGLRQDRIRLRATADLWTHDDPVLRYGGPDILAISVTNSGSSRVTIGGAYWCIGRRNPIIVSATVGGGSNPWQPKIDAQSGADGAILMSDVAKTLAPSLREQGGRFRLFIRLASGQSVECRLSASARKRIEGYVR
jgi:hypothetical protein